MFLYLLPLPLLLLLLSPAAATFKKQSVAARGVVVCHGQPVPGVTVRLMDYDGLDWDDLMAEGETDRNGAFYLQGTHAEVSKIDPYIRVEYDCGPHQTEKVKKVIIPEDYVSHGSDAERVYIANPIEMNPAPLGTYDPHRQLHQRTYQRRVKRALTTYDNDYEQRLSGGRGREGQGYDRYQRNHYGSVDERRGWLDSVGTQRRYDTDRTYTGYNSQYNTNYDGRDRGVGYTGRRDYSTGSNVRYSANGRRIDDSTVVCEPPCVPRENRRGGESEYEKEYERNAMHSNYGQSCGMDSDCSRGLRCVNGRCARSVENVFCGLGGCHPRTHAGLNPLPPAEVCEPPCVPEENRIASRYSSLSTYAYERGFSSGFVQGFLASRMLDAPRNVHYSVNGRRIDDTTVVCEPPCVPRENGRRDPTELSPLPRGDICEPPCVPPENRRNSSDLPLPPLPPYVENPSLTDKNRCHMDSQCPGSFRCVAFFCEATENVTQAVKPATTTTPKPAGIRIVETIVHDVYPKKEEREIGQVTTEKPEQEEEKGEEKEKREKEKEQELETTKNPETDPMPIEDDEDVDQAAEPEDTTYPVVIA